MSAFTIIYKIQKDETVLSQGFDTVFESEIKDCISHIKPQLELDFIGEEPDKIEITIIKTSFKNGN